MTLRSTIIDKTDKESTIFLHIGVNLINKLLIYYFYVVKHEF